MSFEACNVQCGKCGIRYRVRLARGREGEAVPWTSMI